MKEKLKNIFTLYFQKMSNLQQLSLEELLHEYDRSFHEEDPDGMQNVQQECRRRDIDFWKVYKDYVIGNNWQANSTDD